MQQRIDLESLYGNALRQASAALADQTDGPVWPEGCLLSLGPLLDRDADPANLAALLASAAPG